MDTVFEHSAGGIVTRNDQLVIVRTRNLKGDTVFTLPKGHLEAGENPGAAASRESHEETGFEVEMLDEAMRTVTYWYVRDGHRVKKRVDWFRFVAVGGDPGDHDVHEIDEVLVLEVAEALSILTYRSEREIVKEALCE